MIYVSLLVNRFQKSILLIVQYNCLKSCSKYLIFQNLDRRTRSCSTGFITQSLWLLHFHPTKMVGRTHSGKYFFHHWGYHRPRGMSGGPVWCIGAGGWSEHDQIKVKGEIIVPHAPTKSRKRFIVFHFFLTSTIEEREKNHLHIHGYRCQDF